MLTRSAAHPCRTIAISSCRKVDPGCTGADTGRMLRHICLAVLFFILVVLAVLRVQADNLTETQQSLYEAMRSRLTLGSGYPVAHCRYSGRPRAMDLADPWSRCRPRLEAFAQLFDEAAEDHNVDPWLLLAIAVRESGLHPHAEGSIGERGLVQLHPRGVGRRVPFVRNDQYFRQCRVRRDGCQREVLQEGASHLRGWIDRCGSEASALGGYNRGRCGVTSYSRRVLAERERLRNL